MIHYTILLLKIWSVVILNLFNSYETYLQNKYFNFKIPLLYAQNCVFFVATISVIIYIGDIAVCQNKDRISLNFCIFIFIVFSVLFVFQFIVLYCILVFIYFSSYAHFVCGKSLFYFLILFMPIELFSNFYVSCVWQVAVAEDQ